MARDILVKARLTARENHALSAYMARHEIDNVSEAIRCLILDADQPPEVDLAPLERQVAAMAQAFRAQASVTARFGADLHQDLAWFLADNSKLAKRLGELADIQRGIRSVLLQVRGGGSSAEVKSDRMLVSLMQKYGVGNLPNLARMLLDRLDHG